MAIPTPIPAGMVPAPVAPGLGALLTTLAPSPYDAVRAAAKAAAFRRLQDERDAHAERCTGRALLPNPCHVLWSLDERLRLVWAEIEFLGGTVVDVYQPVPCAPECADCAAAVVES